MQSDDVFQRLREALADEARERFAELADAATTHLEDEPTYLAMTARPKTQSACGLTAVISSEQCVDLEIAGEIYQDLPAVHVEDLLSLFTAAIRGEVVTRTWRHRASGRTVAVDTVFDSGTAAAALVAKNGWQLARLLPGNEPSIRETSQATDKRFTPWRR
jgi:hypothetical protein